ncbi:hypothetical protein FOS14_23490 [Skermania sp. ID1734]|uniref:hypothetical protein n=1 Tax=Skermania sp. ID1734 TaxID=2597516 RepID=UPI00117F3372|nr:hypothetical protein [Skermania sp. ID1734]TSD93264.1 hypothetical protein FOS14_23490 [Skermania sp. ID1734]
MRLSHQHCVENAPAPRRSVRRLAAAAAGCVLAVGLTAGCATRSGETTAPPSTSALPGAQGWSPPTAPVSVTPSPAPAAAAVLPPQYAGLDRSDPDAVARAVLTLWFTWDPAIDTDSTVAQLRAAPLLTAALTNKLRIPVDGQGQGGDLQWHDWAAAGMRLVPTISPGVEPVPLSTDTAAYRQFVVDQAITGPDGRVSGTQHQVVDVVLTRPDAGSGWALAQVDQQ